MEQYRAVVEFFGILFGIIGSLLIVGGAVVSFLLKRIIHRNDADHAGFSHDIIQLEKDVVKLQTKNKIIEKGEQDE